MGTLIFQRKKTVNKSRIVIKISQKIYKNRSTNQKFAFSENDSFCIKNIWV